MSNLEIAVKLFVALGCHQPNDQFFGTGILTFTNETKIQRMERELKEAKAEDARQKKCDGAWKTMSELAKENSK
jgi:hypothetical protein